MFLKYMPSITKRLPEDMRTDVALFYSSMEFDNTMFFCWGLLVFVLILAYDLLCQQVQLF